MKIQRFNERCRTFILDFWKERIERVLGRWRRKESYLFLTDWVKENEDERKRLKGCWVCERDCRDSRENRASARTNARREQKEMQFSYSSFSPCCCSVFVVNSALRWISHGYLTIKTQRKYQPLRSSESDARLQNTKTQRFVENFGSEYQGVENVTRPHSKMQRKNCSLKIVSNSNCTFSRHSACDDPAQPNLFYHI